MDIAASVEVHQRPEPSRVLDAAGICSLLGLFYECCQNLDDGVPTNVSRKQIDLDATRIEARCAVLLHRLLAQVTSIQLSPCHYFLDRWTSLLLFGTRRFISTAGDLLPLILQDDIQSHIDLTCSIACSVFYPGSFTPQHQVFGSIAYELPGDLPSMMPVRGWTWVLYLV